MNFLKCRKAKGGGSAVEGGGVKAEEKRKGVAVWEVGEGIRVSILPTAMLSCLN